jgi:hypothetical protein
VAQAGGGWFSEHDVFLLRKCTHEILPNQGNLTVWENVVPSLVSGSSAEFARGAQLLAETIKGDGRHSDILALVQLSRNNLLGDTFIKERTVISGSRAMDGNITNCFEGKLAVHFNTYNNNDIKSIVHWLESWARSKYSDLPKKPLKAVVTPPNNEGNPFSNGLRNQKLATLLVDQNALLQKVHDEGIPQAGEHTRLQELRAPDLLTFDGDTVTNEVQSHISRSPLQSSRTPQISASRRSASQMAPGHNLPRLPQHVGDDPQALRDDKVSEQEQQQLPVQPHAAAVPTQD